VKTCSRDKTMGLDINLTRIID